MRFIDIGAFVIVFVAQSFGGVGTISSIELIDIAIYKIWISVMDLMGGDRFDILNCQWRNNNLSGLIYSYQGDLFQ